MSTKSNSLTSTELSQQSIEFLGLDKQPFGSEILSDAGFFKLPALEKIYESLIHQIQFTDLLLIVEGLQGSGKTSLFRQLIQAEIQNIKLLPIQAEATDTLIQIQQKISLHMQDLGDANHLDDNLKSLQMFDQTPLVIIDNCHVLSDITLQELFRYQQQLKADHEVTLKLLLFANTGMSDTLQNITDIQPDHMYVQNIPEYTAKQANEFIMHRLKNAGYSGELLFKDSDFETQFKKMIATPINIMSYAAPSIDKTLNKKNSSTSPFPVKAIIAAFSLVITLAVAGYFFIAEESSTQLPETPRPSSDDVFVNDMQSTEETEQPQQLALIAPEEPASDHQEQNEASLQPEETLTDLNTSPEAVPQDTINSSTLAPEKAQLPPPVEIKKEAASPQETPTAAQAESTIKPVEAQLQPKPVIKQTTQIQPDQITPEQVSPAARPTSLHPALVKLKALGSKDATWIKQQPNSAWTKQLLGAREPETLLKFVRKHHLGSSVAWYATTLKNKPYYVLIHGSYASRDTARASIANLPPSIRALKPWVKSMKAVQSAIE